MRLGSPGKRLQFGLVAVLVLFAVIGGRLVQLQGLDGTAYASQAERLRLRTVVLPAQRGDILDRDGNILARTVAARTVFADPTLVVDPAATAARLAAPLGVDQPTLLTQLTKPGRFVILKRAMLPEAAQAVVNLKLAGIGTQPESQREVPGHDLAANVIGFVGRDGTGLAGIESRYDTVLRGKAGVHDYQTAPGGQAMPSDLERTVPAVPGRSVQLTLDRDLQFVAQQALSERMKQTGAYTGSAVVLDVKTFQVMAMASYPTFDAGNPAVAPATALGNAAVSNVVEPGSIHKAVTISGALQAGVIDGNTVMTVPPTITKGGKTFRDTHKHGTVGITLMGILAQSSNVGTIEIADRLGAQGVYDYQRKFGLGSKTGLDFPGESPGIVQPPSKWSGPSYGGIPIGLGVAVTPLQMAVVYATIANNGLRLTPSLVRGFKTADGDFVAAPRPKATRVVSPEVAAIMRTDLSAITSKHATGKSAAIPGYVVAGKTGTGQRVENGHYTQGNVTSFIGMAPAANPRYVVAVFVHAPNGVGGAVSGPVFQELMGYLLRHYRVPPEGKAPPELFLAAARPGD
ncbi:MAG: penicillin-binding protein 2 [Pseudonocardiales bacterium]|nr:MAG: penicillin-binding protein 2 [Pseudonocardiales bacterium]